MEYKPHDYQQFAINYILEHPIAAVILGMGLGKTSITLTAIEQLIYDSFEVSKVLVVAPLRVARNTWSDEIHKWNHLKHLLDKQIQVEVKELEQLREMRGTIQGCSYGEKIGTNPNRNLEAPFIKTIEKIWDYEQRIDAQINRLVDLRSEINAAIESMENPEERLLLKYRYLKNESWEDISYELNVSYRTVHRIHASSLNNFVVPE